MQLFIFAAETAELASTNPPGDDFQTASLVMLGITLLVTAVATWRVTPKAEHH